MSYVIEQLWRKAWQVPPGSAKNLHRVLAGWHRVPAEDRIPLEVQGRGFRVWQREQGPVWVEVDGQRQPIMLEGRSRVQSFADMLEAVSKVVPSRTRLVLEIRVAPNVEFEGDGDDLGRMAAALEQMYGGFVSAKLTREEA